jgi:hypothetical protein
MKLRSSLLALGLAALGACSSLISTPVTHSEVRAKEFERKFTPAELAQDLDFLVQVCDEVHPRPFGVRSREEIAALSEALRSRIDRPLTRLEFWPLAAKLAAGFGDAHTAVQLPAEEWSAYVASGAKFPAIATLRREGAWIIVKTYQEDLAPLANVELRAVNGIELNALWSEYRTERAGEEDFVLNVFASNLNWHLWRAGVRPPFELSIVQGGGTVTYATPGLSAEELRAKRAGVPSQANWSLNWLDGDVARIDFRSMTGADAWGKFLEASFKEIRARPAKAVIVDLRRNGGGDSSLGETLLSYLNERPYRMAARKEWRSSARYRQYMKAHVTAWLRWLPLQYFSSFGRDFWGVDEGALFIQESGLTTPEKNPLRFEGPWCLLIGPGTFSSAMMLANAVGDYDLAPLFGAPTGGVPNACGEVYSCDLPHTHLELGVSSAIFIRANGDGADPKPVQPTRPVVTASADAAAGRDGVLEAAREWALSANQSRM